MNEDVIKNYETDFELFCSLAADSQLDSEKCREENEIAIYLASRHAFELAACQMMFRLELLEPQRYWFSGPDNRGKLIAARINFIIKEKQYHDQKT